MGKRTKTDLESVKNTVMDFAEIIQPKYEVVNGQEYPICDHPFMNSPLWISPNGQVMDLTKEENYEIWKEDFKKVLDRSEDVFSVFVKLQSAYGLTFIKHCGQYLSDKDFAEMLALAWTLEENPNGDINMTKRSVISAFKKADKNFLMSEYEREHFENLPEKVVLYRGVAEGRVKLGLSWTEDQKVAEWFKNRFGKNGRMLKVETDKKNVLAYFNSRGEDECVLDVFKVKNDIVEI